MTYSSTTHSGKLTIVDTTVPADKPAATIWHAGASVP